MPLYSLIRSLMRSLIRSLIRSLCSSPDLLVTTTSYSELAQNFKNRPKSPGYVCGLRHFWNTAISDVLQFLECDLCYIIVLDVVHAYYPRTLPPRFVTVLFHFEPHEEQHEKYWLRIYQHVTLWEGGGQLTDRKLLRKGVQWNFFPHQKALLATVRMKKHPAMPNIAVNGCRCECQL